MRHRLALVLVVVIGALGVPAGAFAAAPVLLSVGQTSGHLTATWFLPPGVEARVAEAAQSPATSSDGNFFFENVLAAGAFDTLTATQTTWTYNFQNKPGTYYIHIAGYDSSCLTCPIREFSQMMTVTIPGAPPPPPPPPPPIPTPRATLFVTRSGDGSGSVTSDPGGVTCPADCDESFVANIHVNLRAVADAGSTFSGWGGGGCSGAAPSCEVVMTSTTFVTALFSKAVTPTPPPPPTPPSPAPVLNPNKRPTAMLLSAALVGHGAAGPSYYVTVQGRLQVCDDSRNTLLIEVLEAKKLGTRTFARARSTWSISGPTGLCKTTTYKWRLRGMFFGVGTYTFKMRLRDARGAWSNTVSKSWYTND